MNRNALLALAALLLLLASCAPSRTVPTTQPVVTAQPTDTAIPVTEAATQPPPPAAASATPQGTQPPAPPNTGIPVFDHIVLIVLENRDYAKAMDASSMPHLNELAQKNVLLSNYFAAGHPSLPNYLALMSGSTQGVTNDCQNCFINGNNLADELEKSGRSWKAYLESMPSPCFLGDSDPYAQKHNPLLYFNSVRLNPSRCANSIVPITQLDEDLHNNKLPNFSFIMPNLCNSGHDCTASTADNWLHDMVQKLQDSSALGQNSLIVITFDEASDKDKTSCCGLGKGGGKVATILISPQAKSAFNDTTAYSHYSLLKTFLVAWNLPNLGKTQKAAVEPITAPWISNALPAQPASTP